MAYSYANGVFRPDTSPIPTVSTYDPTDTNTYQAVLQNISPSFAASGGYLWWYTPNLDDSSPFGTDVTISFRVWYALEADREYIYIYATDATTFVDTYLQTNLSTATDPYGGNPGFGITGRSGGWVTCTATIPANTNYIEIGYSLFDSFFYAQGFSISQITLDGVTDSLGPGTIWTDGSSLNIIDIDTYKPIALNDFLYTEIPSSSTRTTFPVDTPFRLRVGIKSSGTTSDTLKLQYEMNGVGGWIDVGASTPIKIAASSVYNTDDVTTETSLTSSVGGVFVAGSGTDTTATRTFTLTNTQRTELEFCVQFDSAQVAETDEFRLRAVEVSGGTQITVGYLVARELGGATTDGWFWGSSPLQDTDASDFAWGYRNGVEGSYNDRLYRLETGNLHFGDPYDGYPMVIYYDYPNDQWVDAGGRDLTSIIPFMYGAQSAIRGNKIYCANAVNGDTFDSAVGLGMLIYDIDLDTWTTGADPPAIANAAATDWWRTEGCAVGFDNKIMVIGGESNQMVPVANQFRQVLVPHIYDTTNNTWSEAAVMPTDTNRFSHEYPSACVIGRKVYVTTQYYAASGGDWARLAIYDIDNDSWEIVDPTADIDEAHQFETATPLPAPDGTLWIACHHTNGNLTPLGPGGAGVLIYNPSDGSWTNGSPYPFQMTLGHWFTQTQKGWTQYASPAARFVYDGFTDRTVQMEVDNWVAWRSHAAIGGKLFFTDYQGGIRVYGDFVSQWDVLSTVATIDHDLLIGVEEDQHHARYHHLDADMGPHTGGLFYKLGTHITDADFINPTDGMVGITYRTEPVTGKSHRMIWVRAAGVWRGVEA